MDMIQIKDRDLVELQVNGETVFTCKQRDLDFGESWFIPIINK